MRFRHIYEAIHFRPWFISAQGYASVKAIFDQVMAREQTAGRNAALDECFADFVRQRPPLDINEETGIAKIHVFGVVGRNLSNVEKSCGNTGYEEIESEIEEAEQLGASGVLFKFDTPGGACVGGDECAKVISQCALPKVAYTEQACSMGFYLAAGCDHIVSSTTSLNGNIGVICPWVDTSKLWSVNGMKFDAITNTGADYKSTFHGPSITDEQRAFIQEDVDGLAKLFHDHVTAHRIVDDEVWKAGWYSGQRALDLGLIDEIGGEKEALLALEMLIAERG